MKGLCVGIVAAIVLTIVAVDAEAVVIWDQPYDGYSTGVASQDIIDMPDYSAYAFDDFSTAMAYSLNTMTMYVDGQEGENSDPLQNVDVVAEIWSGLPGAGGIVASGNGIQVGEDLVIDFAGTQLAAGDYWVTAYVVRPFDNGGQWFWNTTTPVTGSEAYWWNPGGGFGHGTDPIPVANITSAGAADMAFRLEGDPSNPQAPDAGATLMLLGCALMGMGVLRKRI